MNKIRRLLSPGTGDILSQRRLARALKISPPVVAVGTRELKSTGVTRFRLWQDCRAEEADGR